jgi:hypothetical protein
MTRHCRQDNHTWIPEVTNLRARAGQVRPKHDNPGGLVGKLLATGLKPILEKFEVAPAALTKLLILDFVLDDEWFRCEVNWLFKRRRDSVVSSLVLGYETLVALNDRDQWVLYGPRPNITENLPKGRPFRCFRGRPTLLPVV